MIRPFLRILAMATASLVAQVAPAAVTYDDVAPIFAGRCIVCHSGDAAPLGLRLDSLEGVKKGSQKGPVVKAGDRASELLRRVRGESQPRMPLVGDPLSKEEIARLESWVTGGLAGGKDPAKPGASAAPPPRPAPGEPITWTHVAPLLLQRCAECHSDNGILGAPPEGYRLSSYEAAISASDRARIVPGNPGASEVVRRLRGLSRPRMPFDGPPWLSEEDIGLIEEWIRQGAASPAGVPAPMPVGARVRFEGTLTGQWSVDGTPVAVDGGTRIDKGPRVGDRVEVRGSVGPDGRVRVERLRRR